MHVHVLDIPCVVRALGSEVLWLAVYMLFVDYGLLRMKLSRSFPRAVDYIMMMSLNI